jgi:hypothetical protein
VVKIKYFLVAGLVVIIGILAASYIFQGEEKKVRKQFDLLSEYVSKDSGESPFTMARKIQSIGKLFAQNCALRTPIHSLSGTYTPEEISSYAAQGRARFSKLSLRFYDLDIEFPDEGTARAVLTAKLTGTSVGGERVHEVHELECILKTREDKWLFSNFEVIEFLEK